MVLSSAGHEGTTYELSGDVAFTLEEYAREIAKQTGSEVTYQNLPEAEFAAALAQTGLPVPFADALASFDAAASKGALFYAGDDLSTLLGRPTTPMSKAVAQAIARL